MRKPQANAPGFLLSFVRAGARGDERIYRILPMARFAARIKIWIAPSEEEAGQDNGCTKGARIGKRDRLFAKHKSMSRPKRINIEKNGPYHIDAGIPLQKEVIRADENNDPLAWQKGERKEMPDDYVLCRCGGSKNKPFCDGAHCDIGFDDGLAD